MPRTILLDESELADLVSKAVETGIKRAMATHAVQAIEPPYINGAAELARFAHCAKAVAVAALVSGEVPAEQIPVPKSRTAGGAIPAYRWRIRREDARAWVATRFSRH